MSTEAGVMAKRFEGGAVFLNPVGNGPVKYIDLAPPAPRSLNLPGTNIVWAVYTREHMTMLYHCSHGELGRLLARNMAPLPIRVDGVILWFQDEALRSVAEVTRTLERWRKNR